MNRLWGRRQANGVWPVMLRDDTPHGVVLLRPLHRRDEPAWRSVRWRNGDWLFPWEATSPVRSPGNTPSFRQYAQLLDAQGREGTSLCFGVFLDDELVGQISLSSITHSSLCSASIGYWVSEHVAGRGIIPTAVALLTDHAMGPVGLHRVEINIRPENRPSLRVVTKLGFRDEGIRYRYLHIQGQWCDHRTFALTVEDIPDGLLARWQQVRDRIQ